jgi:hypothetical protein
MPFLYFNDAAGWSDGLFSNWENWFQDEACTVMLDQPPLNMAQSPWSSQDATEAYDLKILNVVGNSGILRIDNTIPGSILGTPNLGERTLDLNGRPVELDGVVVNGPFTVDSTVSTDITINSTFISDVTFYITRGGYGYIGIGFSGSPSELYNTSFIGDASISMYASVTTVSNCGFIGADSVNSGLYAVTGAFTSCLFRLNTLDLYTNAGPLLLDGCEIRKCSSMAAMASISSLNVLGSSIETGRELRMSYPATDVFTLYVAETPVQRTSLVSGFFSNQQ